MSLKLSELPVKTLAKVLTELCHGTIGFDIYRDTRTNTKEKLLVYIAGQYTNEAIIKAVEHCTEAQAAQEHTEETAQAVTQQVMQADLSPAIAKGKIAASHASPKSDRNDASQLAELLAKMTSNASVNPDQVREICDARASQYVDNILDATNKRLAEYETKIDALKLPTVVHVLKAESKEVKNIGVQHHNFPKLLKACQAREASGNRMNIWLHGPAGTGKTHAAHAVADALELPFQANGTLLTEHALSGFIDAGGKYHRTAFREIFEHGGVYLGDEYDVWCPKAAMWLQSALANGYTRFPDGMIKRHTDCVIIFGANTVGKGATSEYSTRNKVDDANGNRVVYLEWPLDEALETAISPNPKWTKHVQAFRKKVANRKLKGHMITPRQSMQGAALLDAGLDWDDVETMVLRRGLSDEQWSGLV